MARLSVIASAALRLSRQNSEMFIVCSRIALALSAPPVRIVRLIKGQPSATLLIVGRSTSMPASSPGKVIPSKIVERSPRLAPLI